MVYYSNSEDSPTCEILAEAPIFGSCRNRTFRIQLCHSNDLSEYFFMKIFVKMNFPSIGSGRKWADGRDFFEFFADTL